jgi:hypothetical protein
LSGCLVDTTPIPPYWQLGYPNRWDAQSVSTAENQVAQAGYTHPSSANQPPGLPQITQIVPPSKGVGDILGLLEASEVGSVGTAGPWADAADPVDRVPHYVPGLRLVRVLDIASDVGLGKSCQ